MINTIKEGNYSWHFKHPTIRDAFAAIVASSPDLMDIYLTGAPLEKLFSEISCGDVGLQGVSVIVPASQYYIVIDKIKGFDTSKWFNKSSLYRFLSYRCGKEFLSYFIEEFPDFISKLEVSSYLYASSDVDVLVRLHKVGLLAEEDRVKAVSSIKELAVDVPDSGFLRRDIKDLMSSNELDDILQLVKNTLLPDLEDRIENWRSDYDGEQEPEAYFEELKSTLNDFKNQFKGTEKSCNQIDEAITHINELVEELQSEYKSNGDDDFWSRSTKGISSSVAERSIFDDVDS